MEWKRELNIHLGKYEQDIIESCKNIKNSYQRSGGLFDAEFGTFLKNVLQSRFNEAYQTFLFNVKMTSHCFIADETQKNSLASLHSGNTSVLSNMYRSLESPKSCLATSGMSNKRNIEKDCSLVNKKLKSDSSNLSDNSYSADSPRSSPLFHYSKSVTDTFAPPQRISNKLGNDIDIEASADLPQNSSSDVPNSTQSATRNNEPLDTSNQVNSEYVPIKSFDGFSTENSMSFANGIKANSTSNTIFPSSSSKESAMENIESKFQSRPEPKIKFIPESKRYVCGAGGCNFLSDTEKRFRQHLNQKHRKNDKFTCAHCRGEIDVMKAMNHIQLHGDNLFECNECPIITPTEFNIVLHILRQHQNVDFVYGYRNRSNGSVEKIVLEFVCNVSSCKSRFKHVGVLSKHSRDDHDSLVVDYTVVQTSGTARTANPLVLQQHFLCLKCNKTFITKSDLIAHHNQAHPAKELTLKITKIMQVDKCKSTEQYTQQNASFDRYLMYYCGYCADERPYADLDGVREHWQTSHNKFREVPFQFEIANLVSCHTCKIISSYQGLRTHTRAHHPSNEFVVGDLMDRKKCGLCNFKGDIADHFNTQHGSIKESKMLNPVQIDGPILDKLLIGTVCLCKHCGSIFNTIFGVRSHYIDQHEKEKLPFLYEEVDGSKPVFLITGCCEARINNDDDALITHFEYHNIMRKINCTKCPFKTNDLYDLAKHELTHDENPEDLHAHLKSMLLRFYHKTRVIFRNGLIVSKFSLIGSRFDDSDRMNSGIMSLMKKLAEKERRSKASNRN